MSAVTEARTSTVLCRRVRDGDQAAFAVLVRRNRQALDWVVHEFEWVTDRYGLEREDLMQECLLAFWRAAESYDGSWQATYTTVAKSCARHALTNAVRHARRDQDRANREAASLDAPVEGQDGVTVGDSVPAPEFWQPEILTEIREELRVLSNELPKSLSQVEHEALARVMLDERVIHRPALRRVREKASHVLKYGWAARPREQGVPERRSRALKLLADGFTQVEVAERVGVPHQTVRDWIRGHSRSTYSENRRARERRASRLRTRANRDRQARGERMLADGATVDEVAGALGVSRNTAGRWGRNIGVEARPRQYSPAVRAAAVRMLEQGYTQTAVADRYGVARATVGNWKTGATV